MVINRNWYLCYNLHTSNHYKTNRSCIQFMNEALFCQRLFEFILYNLSHPIILIIFVINRSIMKNLKSFSFYSKSISSYLSRLPPSRDDGWWWDELFGGLSPEELKWEWETWEDELRTLTNSTLLDVGAVAPSPFEE